MSAKVTKTQPICHAPVIVAPDSHANANTEPPMNELSFPALPISPAFGSTAPDRSATSAAPLVAGKVSASWARHLDEVRQAQRLRYDVFAGEMGAQLNTALVGHDIDRFDDYCEHLLVRDVDSGAVVGTYRVLPPVQAARIGSTYSDTEFDLRNLESLRSGMVELGRSCVHRDYRHGAVILALWTALGEFMTRNRLDTMVGCASIPMLHNGVITGDAAASIWRQLEQKYLVEPRLRVTARLALPIDQLDGSLPVEAPALIRGYLRLGAKLLGAPAWDPDFNTADLPMLLRIDDMPSRYQKHFLSV